MKKVVFITAGQPSTNPRLIKEAVVLLKEGFTVIVIYSFWTSWADENDSKIIKEYPGIKWIRVGGHPKEKPFIFLISKIILRLFTFLSSIDKRFLIYSISRSSFFLIRNAKKIKADLYSGHNLASLPAIYEAAIMNNSKFIFDAEDYYRGLDNVKKNIGITRYIEDKFLNKYCLLSAASPNIAEKYKATYPFLKPIVINNVFPRTFFIKSKHQYTESNKLKLFWFSQTVGKNRGIEQVIHALKQIKQQNISFTILGSCNAAEKLRLINLASGCEKQILFIEPVSEKELFIIASKHDIGIAFEFEKTVNRDICLTNKIFTYLGSGLAIILNDTSAQLQLFNTYPKIGALLPYQNLIKLSDIILHYYNNPDDLNASKEYNYNLACSTFNWEREQKIYLEAINRMLPQ